jgi:hypothetical protein
MPEVECVGLAVVADNPALGNARYDFAISGERDETFIHIRQDVEFRQQVRLL